MKGNSFKGILALLIVLTLALTSIYIPVFATGADDKATSETSLDETIDGKETALDEEGSKETDEESIVEPVGGGETCRGRRAC